MSEDSRVLFRCEFTISIFSIINERLLLGLMREGWQWSSLLFCPAGQNNKSGNAQPDPKLRGGTMKQSEGTRPKHSPFQTADFVK